MHYVLPPRNQEQNRSHVGHMVFRHLSWPGEGEKRGTHVPRCPEDAEAKVSLYPKSDKAPET